MKRFKNFTLSLIAICFAMPTYLKASENISSKNIQDEISKMHNLIQIIKENKKVNNEALKIICDTWYYELSQDLNASEIITLARRRISMLERNM